MDEKSLTSLSLWSLDFKHKMAKFGAIIIVSTILSLHKEQK